MAKKQSSKRLIKQDWVAKPEDAIALSALRWYALTIDKICIEIYATDRKKFGALEEKLKAQVTDLLRFAKSDPLGDEDECPEGYVMCDGLCKPACYFE